eukprot:2668430-Amphidinium_carterae.1
MHMADLPDTVLFIVDALVPSKFSRLSDVALAVADALDVAAAKGIILLVAVSDRSPLWRQEKFRQMISDGTLVIWKGCTCAFGTSTHTT